MSEPLPTPDLDTASLDELIAEVQRRCVDGVCLIVTHRDRTPDDGGEANADVTCMYTGDPRVVMFLAEFAKGFMMQEFFGSARE